MRMFKMQDTGFMMQLSNNDSNSTYAVEKLMMQLSNNIGNIIYELLVSCIVHYESRGKIRQQ